MSRYTPLQRAGALVTFTVLSTVAAVASIVPSTDAELLLAKAAVLEPVAIDLDGDGVDEILVPQNQTAGMLAVVYKGPAGYRLQSVNSGFEGTITAFGAVPGDTPMLVAAVVRYTGTLTAEGETQIIITLPTD